MLALPVDVCELSSGFGPAREMAIGARIAGRYRVLELIGEGSVGVVYRARQENAGRDVAIKVLRRKYRANDAISRRFENEARVIRQLRHPNTVRLIDFHETEAGDLCIVTELLRGTSLRAVLQRAGALPVGRVLRIADQVAAALSEAHAAGIVHRDLKPENVFVDRAGEDDVVKVLDFGIAKLHDDAFQTMHNVVLGTPAYMAPEQAGAERADHRTDLYALGVLMFELLAGRPPFEADTSVALLVKHLQQPAPRLSTRLPPGVKVPRPVEALVMQLLAKDRAERPPSAGAVRAQIGALLGENRARSAARGVPASGAAGSEPEDVAVARWPAFTGLVLLALAGLVALGAQHYIAAPRPQRVIVRPVQDPPRAVAARATGLAPAASTTELSRAPLSAPAHVQAHRPAARSLVRRSGRSRADRRPGPRAAPAAAAPAIRAIDDGPVPVLIP